MAPARPTDPLVVMWLYRWMIATVTISLFAAGLAVTLLLPKAYESSVTLLVPRESSGTGLLAGLAASGVLQQIAPASVPSLNPSRDMILGVLKSRTVAEAVVGRFRLQERYRVLYREDAIERLRRVSTVTLTREGLVALKVEDPEPQAAADIANFYVAELQQLVSSIGLGEAGRQRAFVSEQLARAKLDLKKAEEILRRFQERNRAIVLQEQTRGAIEAAGRLKGEIMAAEVQMQVLRSFATDANPEVASLRRRIEEMRRQLAQMQYGDGVSAARRDFTVPFSRVPEVGLELARLTRDVKVQETLVSVLAQNLEQVKIAEARDMSVVQVLDRAVPAERPARPRLLLNLAIGGGVGLVIGTLGALARERIRTGRARAERQAS